MTPRRSSGIVLYRRRERIEVLLGHMGGPFWARKDDGAWSIPKGEHEDGERALDAARREFREELGLDVPDGPVRDLGTAVQSGGKVVQVWAVEGDLDVRRAVFGTFEMEWPRGSGRMREFTELDRAEWFELERAARKVVRGQRPFLQRLAALLDPVTDSPTQ